MSANSKIEWTDHTFNPWIGCTKISPACDHCYAEVSTPSRTMGVTWGAHADRHRTKPSTWNQPRAWNRNHAAFFAEHGRRQRVFCASLADVFDNAVPPEWRAELFELIAATPNLDWLLLTKRIGNVGNMLPVPFDFDRHYPNVWLGATIANQTEADRDIPKLLRIPAARRFLSMEPLLNNVDIRPYLAPQCDRGSRPGPNAAGGVMCHSCNGQSAAGCRLLDWVIVGGESGPGARPMHPEWARSLRDQCATAGVPFLFKQWGEWVSVSEVAGDGPHFQFADGATVRNIGKKAAGRTLDGLTHDGVPESAVTA